MFDFDQALFDRQFTGRRHVYEVKPHFTILELLNKTTYRENAVEKIFIRKANAKNYFKFI